MRKTNLNIKRRKFTRQIIMSFVLGQITIFLLWGSLLYMSQPVNLSECTTRKIMVENIEYEHIYQEHVCRISSNGIQYEFPSLGIWGKYSSADYYEEMKPGKILEITYTSDRSFFRKYNLIVDARNESTIYLNFDSYNNQKEKAFIATIVIFSIIELVFLTILICKVVLYRKKLKLFFPRNRKKNSVPSTKF